jgi:hypothetical protein
MKRALFISIILGVTAAAMALTAFSKTFNDTYKIGKDSNLGKMKCMVCHVTAKGGKQLNPYGTDIQAAMHAAKTKKMTADILKGVEGMDSDKDGTSNIAEIKADKAPGSK